jgi:hypothetical protein
MEKELRLKLKAIEGVARELRADCDEGGDDTRDDLQMIADVCETLLDNNGDLWSLYGMFSGYLTSEIASRSGA